MIPDCQQARAIQYTSGRSLGVESSPPNRRFRGWSSPNTNFFYESKSEQTFLFLRFWWQFVLPTLQMILRKKKFIKKKKIKILLSNFFINFLESSETHHDLVASKIKVTLNFSSNYDNLWWYLGQFSMNFEINIAKFGKLFFYRFQNIVHI